MARRHYVVAYDISDDKRRDTVYRILLDQGDHAQYSVFFCQLNERELADLRGRLRDAINVRDDQVLIVDLGLTSQPLAESVEYVGRLYQPSPRILVV